MSKNKRPDDSPPKAETSPALAADSLPLGSYEQPPAEPGERKSVNLLAFADWVATKEQLAAVDDVVDVESSFVSFFVGNEEYGVPIESVREILRVEEITRVPQAPPHIRGVTNVRGKILPVVEIRTRLGLEALVPTAASRIVVLEVGTRTLGLLVDREARVVKVKASQIAPPPEEIVSARTDYVRGVAKLRGALVILLDPEKTLVVKG